MQGAPCAGWPAACACGLPASGTRSATSRGTSRATLPPAMETYLIRTFGCQMNKHDSERVAGLLGEQGMTPVAGRRGRRRRRLHDVLRARERRRTPSRPGPLAQERQGRRARASSSRWAAASASETARRCCGRFRTSTWSSARTTSRTFPRCSRRRARQRLPQVEILDESTDFTSDLPTEREHPWHAWVPITVGCDNFCTLLHRAVRARPRAFATSRGHRRPRSTRWWLRVYVEVTLLGQNVNSLRSRPLRRATFRRGAAGGRGHGHRSASASRRAIPRTSRPTRSRPWPRCRRSCRTCTCRCSRARIACSQA